MSNTLLNLSLAVALAGIAGAGIAGAARADDEPSSIHGFGEASVKNDYLTPRGLLVTNKELTVQVLAGLVFDLYHDDAAWLDDVSLVAGIWNDIDTHQHAGDVGSYNEFDWFIGPSFHVAKNWTLGVQYVQFISPPHNFNDEQNLEFSVAYDDTGWGLPVALHPYVKLFYAMSGDSTVVTGQKGNTFDVEIGMAPSTTVTLGSLPVTFALPTWITVGPADYWGGTDNWGVFSTGVTAKTPLSFIPTRLGHWSVDTGIQYYNMLNSKLVQAQYLLGTGVPGTNAHRNEFVYTVGIGFGF